MNALAKQQADLAKNLPDGKFFYSNFLLKNVVIDTNDSNPQIENKNGWNGHDQDRISQFLNSQFKN